MKFELYKDIPIKTLDKILEQGCNHEPKTLCPEEYKEECAKHELKPGGILSNESIVKIMELGWLKIWNITAGDLNRQIQAAKLDLRLGNEFWHYHDHHVSELDINTAPSILEEKDMLTYNYLLEGQNFLFHPEGLVLAMTYEGLSLSNVVDGMFDGKSKPGRLGISNHQTAGDIDPGFSGQIMMEISNTNKVAITVPVMKDIASMKFWLLDSPSSRPRQFKKDTESHANNQTGPFGYRMADWDDKRDKALAKSGTSKI